MFKEIYLLILETNGKIKNKQLIKNKDDLKKEYDKMYSVFVCWWLA